MNANLEFRKKKKLLFYNDLDFKREKKSFNSHIK